MKPVDDFEGLGLQASLSAVDADDAVYIMQCYFPRHFIAYKKYWLPETKRRRVQMYLEDSAKTKNAKSDISEISVRQLFFFSI